MSQWQIGAVKVTKITELQLTGGTKFILPDATPEAVRPYRWLAPHFVDEQGRLRMSVHALVLETHDRRILVDACIGNDKERPIPGWSHLQTPFLRDLEAAGYPRESIDTVLCTHLHLDHVGWNTMLVDGKWVPTFANARHLIGRTELAYWQTQQHDAAHRASFADSVQPVVDAGLVDLVETDHRVSDDVRLVPTLGHTPGHVSVEIASHGQQALITGDFIHHPCQMARLDWASAADYDPIQARQTRQAVFSRLAATATLLIGTHFASPTAGRVVRDHRAFCLEV
jgi:glyoxylase-like metal-dependent hydrolase (beta-lactamase superfamily II)